MKSDHNESAEQFVRRLRKGDSIVSTDGCSRLEIAEARACHRFLNIDGLGYIHRVEPVSSDRAVKEPLSIAEADALIEELKDKPWCQICGVELGGLYCDACREATTQSAAEGLVSSPQPELHANCHDLVCNGDRSKPRGTKGVSCSCYQRDKRMAEEFAALKAAEVSSPARPQGLTFNDLQTTNKQRCETAFHSVDAWKPWDWSNAIAGEVGEACAEGLTLLAAIAARSGAVCNLTKKMARVWPANEFKQNWNTPEDQRISDLEVKLANELADVVIYADLLATRIGRSLGDCVRTKFNSKSDEIGSSVKLAEGAVSAAPPALEQVIKELRATAIQRIRTVGQEKLELRWADELESSLADLARLRAPREEQ